MTEKKGMSDFSEILLPYEDQWVALSKEKVPRVIASNKSLSRLVKQLGKTDRNLFEIMKVPRFDACYAPFCL